MRCIAAYLLNVLAGNEDPTSDDVIHVIASVGVDIDEDKLKLVMEKLRGKNIEDIQREGLALLATSVFGTPEPTEEKRVRIDADKQEVASDKDNGEYLSSDNSDDDGEGFMSLFG